MEIEVLLVADSERAQVILAAMPRAAQRYVVGSVAELVHGLGRPGIRAVLFDPNGVGVSTVEALLAGANALGLRGYLTSPPTKRATELLLHAAGRGLAGALLCDCKEEQAALMRQLTDRHASCTLPLRLLAAMRPQLRRVPQKLRSALVTLAASRCHAMASSASLARQTSISTRTSARWLSAAGLAPPRTLLKAFRLAHLGPDLWDASLPMPSLARRGGYAGDRTLRAHCEQLLGFSPGHLRRWTTEVDVIERLAEVLTRVPASGTSAMETK